MKANKKIVFIGDSNTQGYGLAEEESYPALLGERLKGVAKCYNFGVSGSCVISEKLEDLWVGMPYLNTHAYSEACAIEGDIYVFNLGTNDATDGTVDDEQELIDPYGNLMAFMHGFKAHYEKIIKGVTFDRPDAVILICLPIPVGKSIWKKHKQTYLERLLPFIKQIAEENPYYMVDLHGPLLDNGPLEAYYLEDGLHLNPAGAKVIADLLEPYLTRLL